MPNINSPEVKLFLVLSLATVVVNVLYDFFPTQLGKVA